MRLIVGNLPNAVGSPNAAIIDDDGVIAFQVLGKIQPSAIGQFHIEWWKRIARVQLFCHACDLYPAKPNSFAALSPSIFCLSASEIFNCFTVSTARTKVIGTGGVSLPKTT